VEVCRALRRVDPWAFGVATIAEAAHLREHGIDERILIFTPLLGDEFEDARRLGVTPTLGSPEAIQRWTRGGAEPWHLAIDTGMHRAGIEWWRVSEVEGEARRAPPEGACTHFHSADAAPSSIDIQQQRFREALAMLPARPAIVHAENSPASERQSPSPWDLVRPGVFLYGVGGGPGSSLVPEPVAHFRARVVEIHDVRAGESVSYGATWRASAGRRVATIAAGYADGYRRNFSNRGHVLLRGQRSPVVGRVTMDMTMVDVTDVACDVGDVATLLGTSGDDHLDINRIAPDVDLLSYELLVGLALRVPRIHLGALG
jgi:alanine racemase